LLSDRAVGIRTLKDNRVTPGQALVGKMLAWRVNMDYDGDTGYLKLPGVAAGASHYNDWV